MMNDKKRAQVYNVLLTPIECTEYSERNPKMKLDNSTIKSTQTYYPYKQYNGEKKDIQLDPDMSDFAIGFYEIIYKDILDKSILHENDGFANKEFAGDTMNTGIISKDGRKTKLATDKRHCLANFWILPMWIGRDWTKNPHPEHSKTRKDRNDYMASYLKYVEGNWSLLLNDKNVGGYFNKFKNSTDFRDKHFIPNNVESEEIQKQLDFIKERAKAISESKHVVEELWEYFFKNGLLGYKETYLELDEYPLNKEVHPYSYECPKCNRIIANDENYSIPPVCDECAIEG